MNFNANPSPGEALEHSTHARAFLAKGDAETIKINGSAAALKRQGVDIGLTFSCPLPYEDRVTVRGADNHDWQVWGEYWFGLTAERARTAAESEAFIDYQNSRTVFDYFSLDRRSMCQQTTWELLAIGAELVGDKVPTRQTRRLMRKRIQVLATVQMALMRRDADMHALRQQLAGVGIHIAQEAYVQ